MRSIVAEFFTCLFWNVDLGFCAHTPAMIDGHATVRLCYLATNTTWAENHGLSQLRFSNEVKQQEIMAKGWWAVTTIMRPRGHDQERGTCLCHFAFQAQASPGRGTGRASKLRAIEKKNGQKMTNIEWEANESTWYAVVSLLACTPAVTERGFGGEFKKPGVLKRLYETRMLKVERVIFHNKHSNTNTGHQILEKNVIKH